MGACLSLDSEEVRARARSEEIDRQLAIMAKQELNVVKMLLLGAGESGKSTLVKQVKIIHHEGFSPEELRSFRPTVRDNLLSSMQYVLSGMGLLRINLRSARNRRHARTVLAAASCNQHDRSFSIPPSDLDKAQRMSSRLVTSLRALWQDEGVRLAVARGYEYELNDSALYLFENMDRICDEGYVPTSTDVLRARVRTDGVIETHFKVRDTVVRMVDVGGQRSQRRKWIYCFDDVRALLFVVSLSGYDMTLVEAPGVNRLAESLTLFGQIVNNRFFRAAATVLFLNKLDLFRQKILYSGRHLRLYFPDFDGGDCDVDHAALYLQRRFSVLNRDPHKVVYPHFTTATDTADVQAVFQVVLDTVIRDNLRRVALL